MAITDFRKRYLSLVALQAFFVVTLVKVFINNEWPTAMADYLVNMIVVGFVLGLGSMYVLWIKKLSPRKAMGMGDVLLLFPVCCWFPTVNFVIWLNLTLIATLVMHQLFKGNAWYLGGAHGDSVPLAGYLSTSLSVYLIATHLPLL